MCFSDASVCLVESKMECIYYFFSTVYFKGPTQYITPDSGLGTERLSKYTLKHIYAV